MVVERMAYIVYFQGKEVLKKLETMPVNISFVSQKANYVVFYGDNKQEKNYFNQLKNVKGFKKIEESSLYNGDATFVVK